MDNPIQHLAIAFAFLRVAEDAPAECGSVQGFAIWGRVGCVFEEEIWCAGAEIVDDCFVAGCAGFDDFAGENVGVDYGEGVGWGGEDGGDGGFASGYGAGEADDEHVGGGFLCVGICVADVG